MSVCFFTVFDLRVMRWGAHSAKLNWKPCPIFHAEVYGATAGVINCTFFLAKKLNCGHSPNTVVLFLFVNVAGFNLAEQK
jgi:hypothetical protein